MHRHLIAFVVPVVVMAVSATGCRESHYQDVDVDARVDVGEDVDAAPPGTLTGTFIDRKRASDLRVVSYNVNFDSIFVDENSVQAARFVRVMRVLNPDILNLQEIRRPASEVVALMNGIVPLGAGATWRAHQGRDNVIVTRYSLSMTGTGTSPPGSRELAMALVDLPDEHFAVDLYVMNNHYRCCSGPGREEDRQAQSDALVRWMGDARAPGGAIELPSNTAMAVVGDLNIVEPAGVLHPLDTLITGDIVDEATYGPDSPPDWDGTPLADARPMHNEAGSDDYTWRDDTSPFVPGRLDYILFTDSVLTIARSFVLDTVAMTQDERDRTGLQEFDVTLDSAGAVYDHLPLLVDFRMAP